MRAITFRSLAPGHWVNTETGVELIRGTHKGHDGKLRWFVAIPHSERPEGRQAIAVKGSLANARRYARTVTVPEVRELIADAWDEAHRTPAPATLVFKPLSRTPGGRTWYSSQDGRYDIIGRPVAGVLGSERNPDRAFTPYRGDVPVGPAHRRLTDAITAAQRDWDDLCKAHNSARLMEAARVAGDLHWQDASHGQQIQALTEDARWTRECNARRGTGPRQLSGWGQLRAAHRAAALS